MKSISLKQPWASLLFTPNKSTGKIEGLKSIETRTWKTNYRGPLLICTSQKPDSLYTPIPEAVGICRVCGCTDTDSCLNEFTETCHWQGNIDKDICSHCFELKGMAIGIVNLVNCRPMEKSDRIQACIEQYQDAWAWELEDPRILIKPFPIKGQLGIFNVKTSNGDLNVTDNIISH